MVKELKIRNKLWEWGKRTFIMGILNVTPDSFSDGGKFNSIETAVLHASRMVSEGADIIDIGGETTKPGFTPISHEQEAERVIPVIKRITKELDIPVSVDTYKAETAELALKAGAHMLNDIWGLKKDPEMASIAAAYKVPICIMHNRPDTNYVSLIEDMLKDLEESIEIAIKAGIEEKNIILDPGIGFGKTLEQNLQVMKSMDEFKRLGYPILLGASRKSFIGKTLGLDTNERLEGTIAVTAVGIMKGADIVRVHDVLQNSRAAKMTDSIVRQPWIKS